jgi:hypothetical protein
MKIVATGKMNVADIPKDKLYKGKKGIYLQYKIVLNTEEADQFGNNGALTVNQSKEEREAGEKIVWLGNHKIMYMGEANDGLKERPTSKPNADVVEDDDLPF